jgi:hypothetical protein
VAYRIEGVPAEHLHRADGEWQQGLPDGDRVGGPVGRVLGEQPLDQPGQVLRNVAADHRDRRHRLVLVLQRQVERVRLDERRVAGEQLEQDAAEGVEVGGLGHRRRAELLRGHVAGGADRDAAAGHPGLVGVVDDPAHAEVEHLDPAAAQQHDVRRLEVAVDDVDGVRGGQPVGDLRAQGRHPGHRELRVLGGQVLEQLAVEQFHREVRQAAVVDTAVDGARQVGMVGEPAHDPHLAGEPVDRPEVVDRVEARTVAAAQDQLDRHHPVRVTRPGLEVLGPVDLAHVALADGSQQPKPARHQLATHVRVHRPRPRTMPWQLSIRAVCPK